MEQDGSGRPAVLTVLAAATALHLGLCALYTWGITFAPSLLVPAEAVIVAAAVVMSGFFRSFGDLACALLVAAFVVSLHLLNPEVDLIVLRHLVLAFVFYRLGTGCDVSFADRAIKTILVTTLAVGIFELTAPGTFSSLFNVWEYFSARGLIDSSASEWNDTSFFVSANRDGGRNIFAFLLGSHRVSSVFLEPVSAGNFAAICFAWFISVRSSKRLGWILLACAMIVLSDSRFAAACCSIMAAAAFAPVGLQRAGAVLAMPASFLGLLIIGAATHEYGTIPTIVSDDFAGRIAFSGRVLWSWEWEHWLALVPSPAATIDAGHAYLANNLGGPAYFLIWILVILWHLSERRSAAHTTFVLMLNIYFAALLCVTGTAAFSMKTAALAWLLCGALWSGARFPMAHRASPSAVVH
jgi:putative polymerase